MNVYKVLIKTANIKVAPKLRTDKLHKKEEKVVSEIKIKMSTHLTQK